MDATPFIIKPARGVYKITCLENGRFYIGSSHDVFERWRQHLTAWVKHKNYQAVKMTNPRLMADVMRFGKEAFTFQVLHLCPAAQDWELRQKEAEIILKLAPYYNILK
jgi:group I intron endonuclease